MSDQSGSTVSERISCIIKIINIASGYNNFNVELL
jgi:hypothetical protein